MELINKDNLSSLYIGDLLYKVTFDKCIEVIFDGEIDDGMLYYYDEWDDDLCRSIRRDRYVSKDELDGLSSMVFYRGVTNRESLINARIGLIQREVSRLNKSLYGLTLPL